MHKASVKDKIVWSNWPRIYRQMVFFLLDAVVVVLSLYIAFWLRFDGSIPPTLFKYVSFLYSHCFSNQTPHPFYFQGLPL